MSIAYSPLETLPALIQESSAQQFSFYVDNTLYTGINFENKPYVLHRTFRQHKRNHALTLATELAGQDKTVIVTVSSQGLFYRVWLSLCQNPHLCAAALRENPNLIELGKTCFRCSAIAASPASFAALPLYSSREKMVGTDKLSH